MLALIWFVEVFVLVLVWRIWSTFRKRSHRVSKKLDRDETCHTLIVFGSGGHTSEMLALIKKLNMKRYAPIHVVVAGSDSTSLPKMASSNEEFAAKVVVHRIRRSREVGQSFVSSIWTTLLAFWDSIQVVFTVKPQLVLCNGPGTCVPVCVGALLIRFLGLVDPCIVFVESFCRVESLSLSGHILYRFVDRFVVQWPQLAERFPKAEYLGTLF